MFDYTTSRSLLAEFDGLHGHEYEPLPLDEGEGLDELGLLWQDLEAQAR